MKLVAGLFIAVLSIIMSGHATNALSSDQNHFISADNTFYAYVNAGEKIGVEFIAAEHNISTNEADVTISVEGPDIEKQTCIARKGTDVGKGCVFKQQTSNKTGIWKISFVPGKEAKSITSIHPNVRWTRDLYDWKITIVDGNDEQKGRVWSDQYAFIQTSSNLNEDLTTFYISEDGYIYRVKNYNYKGKLSVIMADSIGVRKGVECVSAYRSAEVSDTSFSPALGTCGNRYKLFFEEPSGSLPTESVRWDGVTDWIKPQIKKPSISELHFVKDDSNDQLSGDVTFYLRNFIGQYQVKIDVDNDGGFDGQNDVTLYQQMQELSSGLQRVHFQGVNKQGQIIPANQTIGIKVDITKVAEIHFVAVDVEGRDGIEVTRLNGENAPISRICWNDTDLELLANIKLITEEIDGRSCPISTNGVHGWMNNRRSWGNARYIDDWIFATATIRGNNSTVYPDKSKEDTTDVSRDITPIIIAIISVLLVPTITILIIRRKKRTPKSEGNESNDNTPPSSNIQL